MTTEPPESPDVNLDAGPLRESFERAGFGELVLQDLLGSGLVGGIDLPVLVRRTDGPEPINALVRLFVAGLAVADDVAQRAAPAAVDDLLRAGLLVRDGDDVRAAVRVMPFDDLLVFSDFGTQLTGRPHAPDHVLGVGAASVTLARLTVRRHVDSVLDLGTGSGVQAFLASRHARRVTGTDVNERALRLADLGAALNGLSDLQWRRGNLFEPVDGETFDLIVSNPPFVISPESRFMYRDGGGGDTISRAVIEAAGRYLRADGLAVILFNWHHGGDDDWARRPAEWLEASDTACDTWILRFRSGDPLTYAAEWLRPTEGRDPEQYGRLLDGWMEHYRELGMERVSAGAVILRRRDAAAHWHRADDIPETWRTADCGEQIQGIIDAEDMLLAIGDDPRPLLDQRFVLAEDHRMEQVLRADGGGWVVTSQMLRTSGGLGFGGRLDGHVATLLAGCDGSRPLGAVVEELAERLDEEPQRLAAPVLEAVRKMLRAGLLSAPADAS